MSTTIMHSLTFSIFTISEKVATLKFLPHTDTRRASLRLIIKQYHIFHVNQISRSQFFRFILLCFCLLTSVKPVVGLTLNTKQDHFFLHASEKIKTALQMYPALFLLTNPCEASSWPNIDH